MLFFTPYNIYKSVDYRLLGFFHNDENGGANWTSMCAQHRDDNDMFYIYDAPEGVNFFSPTTEMFYTVYRWLPGTTIKLMGNQTTMTTTHLSYQESRRRKKTITNTSWRRSEFRERVCFFLNWRFIIIIIIIIACVGVSGRKL